MFFSNEEIKRAINLWVVKYHVDVSGIIVLGSAALLFHGLVDLCNDIDIEIPQADIDRLLSCAIITGIEGTRHWKVAPKSITYPGYDIEHINYNTDKPWTTIDGMKICTLERLRADYVMYDRAKDKIKLQRITAALAQGI
jgi:hypothetical protein